MRISLLVLLSLGLVASAPASREYEKEAREFFGILLNLVKQEKFGDVFDLVAAKGEGLVPGFLKDDQVNKLRSVAVAFAIAEKNKYNTAPTSGFEKFLGEVQVQSQLYMQEKAKMLTDEALTYFVEGLKQFFSSEFKLREFTPDVIAFRKTFDSLSTTSKDSLIKAYPIYGRLEEIQAYVKVFDSIVRNMKGLCTELSGFDLCKDFLSYF